MRKKVSGLKYSRSFKTCKLTVIIAPDDEPVTKTLAGSALYSSMV